MTAKSMYIIFLTLFVASSCTQAVSPVIIPDKPPTPPIATPMVELEKEITPPAPAIVMPPAKEPESPPPSADPEPQCDKSPHEDEQMFLLGLHQLEEAMNEGSYALTAETFNALLTDHPDSPWGRSAATMLALIKSLESYHAELYSERSNNIALLEEQQKVIAENGLLKKNLRALHDKYQAQETSLRKENEKLKTDLQQLKNLELQLEKREKMLR